MYITFTSVEYFQPFTIKLAFYFCKYIFIRLPIICIGNGCRISQILWNSIRPNAKIESYWHTSSDILFLLYVHLLFSLHQIFIQVKFNEVLAYKFVGYLLSSCSTWKLIYWQYNHSCNNLYHIIVYYHFWLEVPKWQKPSVSLQLSKQEPTLRPLQM